MFEFEAKIRYSEVDSDGKLSLLGLLNYFQDCSTFQSEELGVGIEYLKEKGLLWALSAWSCNLCIHAKCIHSLLSIF